MIWYLELNLEVNKRSTPKMFIFGWLIKKISKEPRNNQTISRKKKPRKYKSIISDKCLKNCLIKLIELKIINMLIWILCVKMFYRNILFKTRNSWLRNKSNIWKFINKIPRFPIYWLLKIMRWFFINIRR